MNKFLALAATAALALSLGCSTLGPILSAVCTSTLEGSVVGENVCPALDAAINRDAETETTE
jgi:hypothetical protein